MNTRIARVALVATVMAVAGVSFGNWHERFDGGSFDLTTWEFLCYPEVTGTFTQLVQTGTDGENYVALAETNSVGDGGAAFGVGFVADQTFADTRIGAVVNVAGDASHNYHGLGARMSYFMDDGTLSGAPGLVASGYIMHINWENGPANLSIDIEKVVNLQNIMREDFDVLVPGLAHARSYYAELDVVGSGPVYVTGRLYDSKGGVLVARTDTMVDTAGNDPWEDEDAGDEPFETGLSGIFGQNEQPAPAGFLVTFDDISSVSDGPAAVPAGPADGATDISVLTKLDWTEAAFATGRQLWFGTPGQMQLVEPDPEGTIYDPGMLECGRIYQWRVDEIGPAGTVTGPTWEFTTGDGLPIDNFEGYAGNADLAETWTHNIEGGYEYLFLDTGTVNQGAKAMRFEYQNQYEPFTTEATRTFAEPQDWTVINPDVLMVTFRGRKGNVEQPIFLRIEDAAGNQATVNHPFMYATQSDPWRTWEISISDLVDGGVDLAAVAKMTLGLGNGTYSGQAGDSRDVLYVDNICLMPGEAQ